MNITIDTAHDGLADFDRLRIAHCSRVLLHAQRLLAPWVQFVSHNLPELFVQFH